MQKECALCGNSDLRVLVKHHIIPKELGGDNLPSNFMGCIFNPRESYDIQIVHEKEYTLKKYMGNYVCFICHKLKHLMPKPNGKYKNCFLCIDCYDNLKESFEKKVVG